jgi:enolase-phosphatase E1
MSSPAPKLYLLDVEGTVAPLTLTAEVLFPYARAHFEDFLASRIADVDVAHDLALLALENMQEVGSDAPRIVPESPAAALPHALKYIYWLMDRDRKSTALKSLQGKIWKAGFESGELKGTLFPDVPEAFARWSQSVRVAIYSSGSVEAQKLLFRYSNFGDLTPLISGYFDTRMGAKKEKASYAAIATEIAVAPSEIVFFSDVVAELDAAREAGCGTRLVVRPGNTQVADAHGHPQVDTFVDL